MLFQRAVRLHQEGAGEDARKVYEEILRTVPDHVDALHFLGVLEHRFGHHERAVALIERSLSISSSNPAAYLNLANAQKEIGQFEAALENYEKSIATKADYALAYSNRGVLLHEMRRANEAMESFDKSISLDPKSAVVYFNRANAHREMGQLDAAISDYDATLALQPAFHADVYWNKACALLLKGDFDAGWPLHEWRSKSRDAGPDSRRLDRPLWLGQESLHGKTILLHCEQGLGDSLQFCRYVPMVLGLGAQVILEVPDSLLGIMQTLEGQFTLVARGRALPPFDFHCPLLSLPLAFGTRPASIPARTAYLSANAERSGKWAETLGPRQSELRIGIVWSGSTWHTNDRHRSIPFSEFVTALPRGIEYVSLQQDIRASDLVSFQETGGIRYFGKELADFADTAALCSQMDLVLTVDTSVAHLAAAMGKPTWILLPHAPDWRWMLHRTDSPWYPSVILYRQFEAGDWMPVLSEVRRQLEMVSGG